MSYDLPYTRKFMKRVHIPEARWCLEWPRDVFICNEDIWTCVCVHEIQSNSLSLLRLFITKFSIEKTPRTSDKGFFLGSPQNSWTSSFKHTDAHDGPGRTWNYSVCVLDYDSVLSKHIQMLNPGLLDFLHLNIPSYLAFTLISWEDSYEMKWLYHT